jgi:hypothetical protein
MEMAAQAVAVALVDLEQVRACLLPQEQITQ